ncbi:cysteine hydrolase family protein [Flavivirga rizhaonensis]|uniref:Cysteine hydrolase n=1 Tax=Flavivirga rizhaonensis TaxID=2559571 RepID=A0A4S1DU16_9FLAO|nr:isochorismatase family cysteine hydrolase [Flavivirga rizhaonensis]TGV01313.1 cysteine hydrolase [Flavivirga rizhaonensis]
MQFTLNPKDAVTLIVDMERLFTEPGSPYQNDAAELIEPINKLTALSRELGIPVIHSVYAFDNSEKDAGLISNWPEVEQGYYEESSPWTDWDPRLVQKENDHNFTRNRPGAFWGGTLDTLLKQLGKKQIILGGVSVNNAISFTAHEAFSRDIPVFIVKETTGPAPFENKDALDDYLQVIGTWASEVVSLEDVMKRMTAKELIED